MSNETLQVFPWSRNFETGIALVDEQHRRLVELINALGQAMSQGGGAQRIDEVFAELGAYAVYHFEAEESVWQAKLAGDPWLEEHRRVHSSFLPRVLELKGMSGDASGGIGPTLKFLVNWLVHHILDSDRRMAKVVLAMEAGCSIDEAKRRADEEMSGLMQTLVETVMTMYEVVASRGLDLIRERNERLRTEDELTRAVQRRTEADRLSRSMEQLVAALASGVEVRSPYTAGHQRRVGALTRAIGVELGLEEEQLRGIYLAASIHDVGDVQVPADILVKPGALSPVQLELVRQHPVTGYEILKDVEFPWPIARIVRQHHERMDGTGYPDGLRGDEIELGARMIGVADVVEAMCSHRPYRAALGLEAALAQIKARKGSWFDAKVVEACVRLFENGSFRFA